MENAKTPKYSPDYKFLFLFVIQCLTVYECLNVPQVFSAYLQYANRFCRFVLLNKTFEFTVLTLYIKLIMLVVFY